MDLENECSALESVEDNEVVTPELLTNVSETNIENNGSCRVEHLDDKLLADLKAEGVEVAESVNSPPLTVQSPGGSIGSPVVATTTIKGYGLKKWRRIRRDVNQDGGSSVDSCKILKRGLSNPAGNSRKPMLLSAEMKQKSEGSVSSTNTMGKSPVGATNNFAMDGDDGLSDGPIFAAGMDSENGDDQSSKSSTAASAPRLRYEIPPVVGYARDKNRVKSLGGKNLGNSVQRGQQGKGQLETSKKPRGELVKIEKENSHSSMESDSRSSNFVFMQGTNSETSNGRQLGMPANYDGEDSDDAQGGEQHFREERQTGFRKNVSQKDLAAELSRNIKEEKGENHGSSADQDPLDESIFKLQSAQEALEKEIQKLREIGKEDTLLFDDSEYTSVDSKVHEPSSSDLLQSGESGQSSPRSLKSQMISLKQNVNNLEHKLEEARAMMEVKEAQVIELEATLNGSRLPKGEIGATVVLQKEKYIEMEAEFEGLFKQKIEAEVEYLAVSRTIQKLRVDAVNQITLLEERKTLASEQAQMLKKLEGTESRATMLRRRAEKLETYCGDIVETDEVLKLQKRVWKFTWYFFIQLMLLVVVLGLFVLQLSPHHVGVVPT